MRPRTTLSAIQKGLPCASRRKRNMPKCGPKALCTVLLSLDPGYRSCFSPSPWQSLAPVSGLSWPQQEWPKAKLHPRVGPSCKSGMQIFMALDKGRAGINGVANQRKVAGKVMGKTGCVCDRAKGAPELLYLEADYPFRSWMQLKAPVTSI